MGSPGRGVYRREINERAKTLRLWVPRNLTNRVRGLSESPRKWAPCQILNEGRRIVPLLTLRSNCDKARLLRSDLKRNLVRWSCSPICLQVVAGDYTPIGR